jgi:hypothetical protein
LNLARVGGQNGILVLAVTSRRAGRLYGCIREGNHALDEEN